MKKMLPILLALVTACALMGCGGQPSNAPLNKTIEVPEGALSFMINDRWTIEEEATSHSMGTIYPLGSKQEVRIVYGKTSLGAANAGQFSDKYFLEIISRFETAYGGEPNFTNLEIDPSLSDYYCFAYSYDWKQANSEISRIYNVYVIDSSGINSIIMRVPLDLIDEWENKVLELVKSIRTLPNAETKAQLIG